MRHERAPPCKTAAQASPPGRHRAGQGENQEPVPRMPHERDESADSQAPASRRRREMGTGAHDDVERGVVDTDKGPVLDAGLRQAREGADELAKQLSRLSATAHRVDHARVVGLAEDRAAGHEGVGAGRRDAGDVVGLDAAIHLQADVLPLASMRLRACSILRSAESMKPWPPKPGLTLMIRIRSMSSITQSSTSSGAAGLNTRPGLAAARLDRLDAAVHVRRGVGVEADVVGAGLGEGLRQRVHRLHHQVHVDRHRLCRRRSSRAA